MHIKFWAKNLKGKDYFKDPGVDGRIVLKCILEKLDGKVWTGFIALRIGTRGRLLRTR